MPVTSGVRCADARQAREKQPVVGELLKPFADDDQPVARNRVAERGVGGPVRAAGERHRAAVPRTHLHAIQRAAVDFIGEIERVDNRPDARHRHGRQRDDGDLRGASRTGRAEASLMSKRGARAARYFRLPDRNCLSRSLRGVVSTSAGSAFFFGAALMQEHHMVRHVARKTHFVRDDDHRAAFFGELLHHLQHFADQFGIERGSGFVEQHHVRDSSPARAQSPRAAAGRPTDATDTAFPDAARDPPSPDIRARVLRLRDATCRAHESALRRCSRSRSCAPTS